MRDIVATVKKAHQKRLRYNTRPRFRIYINEGAFFHEPWLVDTEKGLQYKYNKIPLTQI